MDGWMDGWTNGWMDKWMDERQKVEEKTRRKTADEKDSEGVIHVLGLKVIFHSPKDSLVSSFPFNTRSVPHGKVRRTSSTFVHIVMTPFHDSSLIYVITLEMTRNQTHCWLLLLSFHELLCWCAVLSCFTSRPVRQSVRSLVSHLEKWIAKKNIIIKSIKFLLLPPNKENDSYILTY